MRTLFVLLTVGLMASISFAQPDPADPLLTELPDKQLKVRTGTPEQLLKEDLNAFISLLNKATDYREPQSYVFEPRIGWFTATDWFYTGQMFRDINTILVDDITVDKITRESATVTVHYKFKGPLVPNPNQEPQKTQTEKVDMKIGKKPVQGAYNRAWQIVPTSVRPQSFGEGHQINVLNVAAYELAQRDWDYSTKQKADRSAKRLKWLGLVAFQSVQDSGGFFAFAPEHLHEALAPYQREPEYFNNPNTGQSYSFNGYLSGKNVGEIREPAHTVMFYEGKDEKPEFRYDGKAAICFADGHVKLLTEAEAYDLIWK